MQTKFSKEDIKAEIWKDTYISNEYEISTLGRLRNKRKNQILNSSYKTNGYHNCGIKGVNTSGHQLVAWAFIPNPNNLPSVCHRDDNPSNNRVGNLFWGTQGDNIRDMYSKGRNTNPKGDKHFNSKVAHQYDTNGNLIKVWDFINDVAKYGFQPTQVSACCRGRVFSHKGFIWSYTELPKEYFANLIIGHERTNVTILQYTLDGKFVKTFKSISEAVDDGYIGPNIVACCQGKVKSHANYIWSYTELDFSNFQKPRWNTRQKKIHQLTLDGKLVKEYRSATSAQKDGFHFPYIKDCLDKKRSDYKGFKWTLA